MTFDDPFKNFSKQFKAIPTIGTAAQEVARLGLQLKRLEESQRLVRGIQRILPPLLLPPKNTFDEASIKKEIKLKLSLAKHNQLISAVDEIDFSETEDFYSGLTSGAELEEEFILFLKNKRLEIDKSVKKLSQAQKLILVAIFKRSQNDFVEWNSVDNNTIKASKSRRKARLIERGLITPNPANPRKQVQVKLTCLGRSAARRILATEKVNFLRSPIDSS